MYDAVYPWETGGVQKRLWELARNLSDEHDVHWYGFQYWEGESIKHRNGVTLHGVTPARDLYVGERRSIYAALAFSSHLIRPLLAEDFDVIDCQGFPYLPCFPSKLVSLARRTKLIVTWHEVWENYWYEYLGNLGGIGVSIERLVARLPDAHIAVSPHTQRALASLGVSDAEVVPNGIDIQRIQRAPKADSSVDILFVGRLIKEKNANLLIRAIAAIQEIQPSVRCIIVGDGPERAKAKRLVERLGLSDAVVMLSPRETYEEILGLMKAADVFALPSRREGFGMVALEAMACGTPIVTVDHPQNATASLVDEGKTGYITKETPESIAQGIIDAQELSSRACVDAAHEYEWERIVQRLEEVYKRVQRETI